MQITLYTGFSKEANSTKQPSGGGVVVNCTLKENVSVIRPVFILDRQNFAINYVQWGNRYYFVEDLVSIRNTTIELHCLVDVMATYKTSIGASSQYVIRSASAFDGHVVDGIYPSKNESSVVSTYINDLGLKEADGSYVVGVITEGGTGVTFYNMTITTFYSFMNFLFGGTYLDAPTSEISLELQKELVNPFQYITSVQWFPFLIGGTSETVKFGFWSTTIIAEKITHANREQFFSTSITIPRHPQSSRGAYVNGSPFTRHMLNLYVWGSFPVDPMYFVDSGTCVLGIHIDAYTGVGELNVSDPHGSLIFRSTAQCGVPIQVSQVTQNLINTAQGILSMVGSAASGNVAGYTGSIVNAIEGLVPQVLSQGAQGSQAGWQRIPELTSTFYLMVDDDNTHLGRPLMARRVINSLSGYIQVERPDVDIVGTLYEKDQIVSYMQSGFYYE